MTNQPLINRQNRQKYLSHAFSLYNLLEALNVPPIFTVAVSQIFTIQDQSENMTFGAQIFGVKIMKSKDNILRILYYSLLCYLFELKDQIQTEVIKNKFLFYVLNNLKTILPAKYQSDHYLRISKKPFLTTSQIKSAFMKFMHLLQRKAKQSKMIIQELNSLPQIDFIFMSIFKSLINYKVDKNGTLVIPEDQLSKLQQKIGFNFKIRNEQIILNNEFHIKLIDKSLEIDQFVIEKYYQPKSSSILSSKLIRKQTTQSVGFVDQDENTKSSQNLLDNSGPLIPKLILSQSTDELQNSNKQFYDLNQFINHNFRSENQDSHNLQQSSTKKLSFSPLQHNIQQTKPFFKKTNNLQIQTQGIQQNLILNKKPNMRSISPRLSQFLRERTQSKSRPKIQSNGITCANPTDFRSYLTFKHRIMTQQHQSQERYQSGSLQKQPKMGKVQFGLGHVNTFGNSKLVKHENNLTKQNRGNANRNIFNQICSPIISPASQNGRVRRNKEGHSSFCDKPSTNNNPQPFRQRQPSKINSIKNLHKLEDKKYNFQIKFNQQKMSNGQVVSKYTLAK